MTNTLTLNNFHNIYEIFNLKEKVYPTGLVKFKKYSFDTIKGQVSKNLHNGTSTQKQLDDYLKKRVKERREKIIDIAISNSWQYFATFTYNPKNEEFFPNGYSHEEAISLMVKWLNNLRTKNKGMRYIIVSEFMKESGLLHFHGLFSNVKWSLSQAYNYNTNEPLIVNDVPIYNLDDYDYGFTTVSQVKDTSSVSIYLSKYITKDLVSLKNKKVFWHSRNLSIPITNVSYIDTSLKDYLKNEELSYYNEFKHLCSSLEIATMTK